MNTLDTLPIPEQNGILHATPFSISSSLTLTRKGASNNDCSDNNSNNILIDIFLLSIKNDSNQQTCFDYNVEEFLQIIQEHCFINCVSKIKKAKNKELRFIKAKDEIGLYL